MRTKFLASAAIGIAVMLAGAPDRALAQASPATPATVNPRAKVADGFSLAVTGDLLGPYSSIVAQKDPAFEQVSAILQSADAAFANHEGSAFDLNNFKGTRAALNGGGYPLIEPELVRDFNTMGIDLVSLANNHGGDWGNEGLLATFETISQAGLVQAGAGGSLESARQPGLFGTPKGRVAMIATASTFVASTPAADGEGPLRPRAGISALRTEAAIGVTPAQMDVLRTIPGARPQNPDTRVKLGQQMFTVTADPGVTYKMDEGDADALAASVRAAGRDDDLVLFSIHAHETNGDIDNPKPGDFLPGLFHRMIDEGADVVVRHGPHTLEGIEIYKGKPIFYGMGSLFFGVGGMSRSLRGMRMPDGFYDSAVATTEFKDGLPYIVRIYPLTIRTDSRAKLGTPVRAAPADAQRILAKLQRDSQPYGTRIAIEKGIGVIRIGD